MSDWRLSKSAVLSPGRVVWDRLREGPPLVLVHGTPSWAFLWREVAPRLAQRFSVYLFDLLGYGDSEQREDQDMSVATQTKILVELLRLWELERPVLVGHDIGAAIVLRAHLLEHCGACRISLVDGAVFNPWNTPTTVHIRNHLDAYRTMPAHIYERVVAGHLLTAVHRPMPPEVLEGYLRPWCGPSGQAAYFRKIEQWKDEHMGALEPLLGTVGVPTQILWGGKDSWLGPAVAERLKAAIPGSTLTLIPSAGHFVMEDAPEEVARELQRFFGS